MRVLLPVTIAAAALAGCASTPTRPDNLAVYRCAHNELIRITFEGDHVMLDNGKDPVTRLDKQSSSSRFLYASPSHSIRGLGFEILYSTGGMRPVSCVPLRQRRDV